MIAHHGKPETPVVTPAKPDSTLGVPALPGMEGKGGTMDTKFISSQQWGSYARQLERANLRLHGKSRTAASIGMLARSAIKEVREDGTLIVRSDWRDCLRKAS